MNNYTKVKKGFTLIELLVVIAIIAILAAILFPVFGRARENGRRSACQSNLKQIGLAFAQYSQDFDEKLPLTGYELPSGTARQWSYDRILAPYVGSKITSDSGQDGASVWACPSDSFKRSGTPTRQPRSYSLVTTRITPWNVGFSNVCANEATNSIGGYCGAAIKYDSSGNQVGRNISELGAPASTFLVAELHTGENNVAALYAGTVHHPINPPGNPSWMEASQNFVVKDYNPSGNTKVLVTPGHFDGWNYLYADGHVKWLRPMATLGKNPVTGAANTNLEQPRGGWTAFDGDDM
jgi:prepilin-type N-terminal cleavage/methylation domain-containing protein/prepilin-type processing-associated H-X9-DG protein